jgi:putative Holliday junction resolvase
MRVAAVDYGRRRIGLAICDPLGIAIRGLDTVTRSPDLEEAVRLVARSLRAEGAEKVIVGLPLHASGDESEMSLEARRFGGRLGEALGPDLAHPIEYVDETLTTWEAEEAIRERGIPLRKAKKEGLLDREAARCLLRTWLREAENQGPAGLAAGAD